MAATPNDGPPLHRRGRTRRDARRVHAFRISETCMALFRECARAEGLRRAQAIERMIGKHAVRVLGAARVKSLVREKGGAG